ncbi:hypothetical protein E2P42_01340 [Candidatus Bathyarchaeota archaeon]|nr:hypothetical protein E2P42_01340 [Candidatus Bathyarchaeota archaeon]
MIQVFSTVKLDLGRDFLKVLAIVTMTIDHVGTLLYPDLQFLKIIGRLAFPLFAYLMVLGVDSTQKPWKYMITILGFAIVSQVPYFLAFEIQPLERLNILFTLFLGALTLHLFTKKNVLGVVPLLVSIIINVEGAIYAMLFIILLKLLRSSPKIGAIAIIALNLQFILIPDIQFLSILALSLIILNEKGWFKKEILVQRNCVYSVRKYAFYTYYPLHLTVFILIKMLFF